MSITISTGVVRKSSASASPSWPIDGCGSGGVELVESGRVDGGDGCGRGSGY